MNSLLHYTNCPACGSQKIHFVLNAKDYTVTGEIFAIWKCEECSLLFTQDVPVQQDIGKYYKSENYISHTDTSKGFINRIYKSVRKRTLRNKRKLVCRVTGKKTGTLLDLGSGVGAFVNEMQQHAWTVTGLEPDAGARKVAKEIFNCELHHTSELFKLPPASFDAITLWHVLEHVHDLHNYLEQLKKILRSDGRLIIAVPNYTSFDSKIYGENWAAYDVPRHLYHFSPLSMQRLIEKHSMKVIDHIPMKFDSYYISLLSHQYKKGRTNWLKAFWNGFRSNLKAGTDSKKYSSVIYVISK